MSIEFLNTIIQLRQELERVKKELKAETMLLAEKNVTANTFMNQVKKVQTENHSIAYQCEELKEALKELLGTQNNPAFDNLHPDVTVGEWKAHHNNLIRKALSQSPNDAYQQTMKPWVEFVATISILGSGCDKELLKLIIKEAQQLLATYKPTI